jgi:hypothetical protein
MNQATGFSRRLSFAFACLWFCRSRAITGSPVHPIGGAALVADPEIPPNTARIG